MECGDTTEQVDFIVHSLDLEEPPPIYTIDNDPRPHVKVGVNNVERLPLLDSGSMACVIGYVNAKELDCYKTLLQPCKATVSTVNRPRQPVDGMMFLRYRINDQQHEIPTLIIKTARSQFIVGINFCYAFDIQFVWGNREQRLPLAKQLTPAETRMLLPQEAGAKIAECLTDQTKKEVECINAETNSNDNAVTYFISGIELDPMPPIHSTSVGGSTNASLYQQALFKSVPKYGTYRQQRMSIARLSEELNEQSKECASYANMSPTGRPNEVQYVDLEPTLQTWWDRSIDRQISIATPLATAYEIAPVEIFLDLLKDSQPRMKTPRPDQPGKIRRYNLRMQRYEINTMETSDTIRTSEDTQDTEEDVLPEKHQCVTEPHELTFDQQAKLKQILRLFPYTPETGPLNCTHTYVQRINTGEATPVMRKQYPLSPYVVEEVRKEIDKLIERDIIMPIESSAWRWPILWVKKKSGGGRICVDARGLNRVTVPDAYPTLNVDTILRNLPKAKYITSLDMTQAFHQMAIAEEDRLKTAFAVGSKFYCYKRAIMGFTNSPADLAKMLDRIFHDLMPQVFHYVDDFIILSDTFDEHMTLLREVARRLQQANLTISREKSAFCHRRLTFLGYVLSEDGLTANPDRVKPILEYQRPRTVKELRRFIGLVTWYRRFIDQVAEILAPLNDLLKGDCQRTISWTDSAEQAFETIKQCLMSPAILAAPDYTLPFKIYTDASLVAGAGVLVQVQDGIERVIAFHSVKFSRTQRNYSATERECLAVLSSVEKFRPYIDGVSFTVVTDHSSLRWLQNLKEPHGKLARWAVRLQAFNITFEHRPGRLMTVPDALSRSIDLITLEPNVDTNDCWYNQKKQQTKDGQTDRYKMENGYLYRRGSYDTHSGDRLWKLCVPKERIEDVLREKHDESAHMGMWKTLHAIQSTYYFPDTQQVVRNYVSKCAICRQTEPSNENTKVPTGQYRDPRKIGRVLSLDLIGPLPASKIHKHMWIIVCVDAFSRYVFTKAITKAASIVITDFLEKDIFFRFDIPEEIWTDNGSQFLSSHFTDFMRKYGICHQTTPVYHPQSNMVEATNKSVKTMIRSLLLEKHQQHTDWSSQLAKVTMHLNTTTHSSTGYSPHYIVFGREKIQNGNEHRLIRDVNDSVDLTEDRLETINREAAEEQRARFEINKRQYNLRAKTRAFNEGDYVYIKNHKLSSAANQYAQKLAPIKRQAIVKSKIGVDSYQLVDAQGNDLGKYHASDMFMV